MKIDMDLAVQRGAHPAPQHRKHFKDCRVRAGLSWDQEEDVALFLSNVETLASKLEGHNVSITMKDGDTCYSVMNGVSIRREEKRPP